MPRSSCGYELVRARRLARCDRGARTSAAVVGAPEGAASGGGATSCSSRSGAGCSRQSNLVSRVLKPAAREAGVEWVTLHSFRHTCASILFRAGLNAKQVQAWLGHHSPAFTLATYVHLVADDLPEAGFLDAVTAAPAPTPEIIHVNKVAEAEPPNGPVRRRGSSMSSRTLAPDSRTAPGCSPGAVGGSAERSCLLRPRERGS